MLVEGCDDCVVGCECGDVTADALMLDGCTG
jgi:hypothetical protein